MKDRAVFFLSLLLFSFFSFHFLHAGDFGFIVNNYGSYGAAGTEEGAFEYNASFIPLYSFLFGETGSFMTSLSFTIDYANEEVSYVPELMRTEFAVRFGALGLQAGRVVFADPTGYIANGLFDGFQLTHASSAGRFGIGAWYTGFLYKKTADIKMTMTDRLIYETPFEFEKFADTYFAPKRALASVDWSHPSVLEMMILNAALTGQIDLNDGEGSKLNSGYFTLKAGLPVNSFLFELAGTGGVFQLTPFGETAKNSFGFMTDFGILWTMPASFASRLAFRFIYASGRINETVGQFIPVTSKYCGDIFQTGFAGNSVIKLNYTARFASAFGMDVTASYFVRNDSNQTDYPVAASPAGGAHLLGGEIFSRFIWSPFSDLQIILGGGVFIPALGNVWTDRGPQWRADLTAVLAVF